MSKKMNKCINELYTVISSFQKINIGPELAINPGQVVARKFWWNLNPGSFD